MDKQRPEHSDRIIEEDVEGHVMGNFDADGRPDSPFKWKFKAETEDDVDGHLLSDVNPNSDAGVDYVNPNET